MEQNMLDVRKEVSTVLGLSVEQRKAIYQDWAQSDIEENHEKCFLLATRLRKLGQKQEAYEASGYLTSKKPSLKSYNIYLASAYNLTIDKELSSEELKGIFLQAYEFYMEKDFEQNIAATLLKVSNFLISLDCVERETFDRVYLKCPDEYKYGNSFIAVQYLRRLIADKRDSDAIQAYEKLSAEVRKNRSIVQIMKRCESCESATNSNISYISRPVNKQQPKRITLISDGDLLPRLEEILSAFSFDLQLVDISSTDLIERLNQRTYKASIAVLILRNDSYLLEQTQANWLFTIGYCVHKFSKGNVVAFVQNLNDPSKQLLKHFLEVLGAVDYQNDVTILTELGRRNIIIG